MKKIIAFFILTLLAVMPGLAGEAGDRRLITVTGTAEVKAVPDEVLISLGVETLRKDLLLAKKTNDQSIKKIMGVAQKLGIDAKDVQTSEISINLQYDYPDNKPRVFNGYQVRNSLVVTLKDLSKFEALLGDILAAGANSLQGVYFQSSEIQKLKVEARKKAVQAAKEKAEFLAAELGQKVGKPFSIVDEDNAWKYGTPYANVTLGNNGFNGDISGGVAGKGDADLAPGQIVIRQSINVSFELQ